MDRAPHPDAPSRQLRVRGRGHHRRAPARRARRRRGLWRGPRAGRVPLHPGLQRPRRTRASGRAGRGVRDRLAPPPGGHGVHHRAHRVGVRPRPLPAAHRGGARPAAHRRGAPGIRRRRPRRLVGDVADAAAPTGSRRARLPRPAAGPVPLGPAAPAELPAPEGPGLRGRSGARRSRLREGDTGGAPRRGDRSGGSTARRPSGGRHRRSPFGLVPFLRTDFWPVAGAALAGGLAGLLLGRRSGGRGRAALSPSTGSAHTPSPD